MELIVRYQNRRIPRMMGGNGGGVKSTIKLDGLRLEHAEAVSLARWMRKRGMDRKAELIEVALELPPGEGHLFSAPVRTHPETIQRAFRIVRRRHKARTASR